MDNNIFTKLFQSLWYRLHSRSFPQLRTYMSQGNNIATHISAFSYGNAGDTLLPVVLRDLFNDSIGVKKWHGKNVHKIVSKTDVYRFNEDDFIIIGGGGLFLADTSPNEASGWQWNCSIEMLNRINKPLIGFALGYNRFRGQEEFKPIFTEHLTQFVNRAIFIGIRNHGSIEALKQYLPTEELRSKLSFQPCMTTLISKIYPNLRDFSIKENFIAINCAFDRIQLRSLDDEYLFAIARVAKQLSTKTSIKYYSHMEHDKNALRYFDEIGVPYELVELNNVRQIVECYSRPRLVIGMRGHAQMIPFGCRTPILSIISHDKMQWFLDDIGHSDWGVDVLDTQFEHKLSVRANTIYDHYIHYMKEIEEAKEKLWDITQKNMKTIKTTIINYHKNEKSKNNC